MTFKELFDNNTLSGIEEYERQDLATVQNEDNLLKLAFALTLRLETTIEALNQVKLEDVTNEMAKKINDVRLKADNMLQCYRDRLELDVKTFDVLKEGEANQEEQQLQEQISELFGRYENRLQKLAKAHEQLTIAEIRQRQ